MKISHVDTGVPSFTHLQSPFQMQRYFRPWMSPSITPAHWASRRLRPLGRYQNWIRIHLENLFEVGKKFVYSTAHCWWEQECNGLLVSLRKRRQVPTNPPKCGKSHTQTYGRAFIHSFTDSLIHSFIQSIGSWRQYLRCIDMWYCVLTSSKHVPVYLYLQWIRILGDQMPGVTKA